MKFLLVNPPIYDFAAYDVWLKPLGLLYLASILKRSGHTVWFFDYLAREHQGNMSAWKLKSDGTGPFLSSEIPRPCGVEEFRDIPLKYRRYGAPRKMAEDFFSRHSDADCVVVTLTMVYWYPALDEVVSSLAGTLQPSARKFLGGNYPSLLPEHAAARYGGFFEKIFALDGFEGFSEYLGLKEKGRIEDFKSWAAPDYSFYQELPYIVIRKSYGCNFSCGYCASKNMCAGFYSKSADKIISELDEISGYCSFKNVAFYDDLLLTSDEKSNIEFLEKLALWRRSVSKIRGDVKFFTPNGLNPSYITPAVALLLKEAGFEDLRLSVESVSEITQKRYGAKSSFRDFKCAMKNLFAAGYATKKVSAYVMAGLPGETIKDVRLSSEKTAGEGARVRLCEFSPVPRTRVFGEMGLDGKTIEPLLLNNTTFIATGVKGICPPWCRSWQELLELKDYIRRDLNF